MLDLTGWGSAHRMKPRTLSHLSEFSTIQCWASDSDWKCWMGSNRPSGHSTWIYHSSLTGRGVNVGRGL